MAKFLQPIAIVGASVSILFHFATFLVLSCLQKKSFSLRLKQHYTLSLCISYFIIVLGLRRDEEESVCRFVVLILQYTITSSFAWMTVEAYVTRIEQTQQSIIKYVLFAWISPLPFLILALIIGLVVNDKIGLRYYEGCWNSDHVIWTFVIPCVILFMCTIKFLVCSLLKAGRVKDNNSSTNLTSTCKDSAQFILKTNLLCLILQGLCWTSWVLIFFYPSENAFHLLFGISSALKAPLLFFLYAVSYIEIYMQNNTRAEECFADYNEVHHGGIELKECSTSQHTTESTHHQPKDDNTIQKNVDTPYQNVRLEENEKSDVVKTEPLLPDDGDTSNDVIQNEQIDTKNIEETTVLVHSPGSLTSLNELAGVANINNDNAVRQNNDNDDEEDEEEDIVKNSDDPGSDVESKSLKSTTTTTTDINDSNCPNDLNERKPSDVQSPPSPNQSPSLNENKKFIKKSSSSNDVLIPDTSARNSLSSSSQSITNKRERDTRASSRTSNISYTSQMGMNELESLFNNPDLLNQSNWKARSRSHASPSRMAVAVSEPPRHKQQQQAPTKPPRTSSSASTTSTSKPTTPTTATPTTATDKNNTKEQQNEQNTDTDEPNKEQSPTETSAAAMKRKKRDSRNEFFDFN